MTDSPHTDQDRHDDLFRISSALDAAAELLQQFSAGAIEATAKRGDDPVTAADIAVDRLLGDLLARTDEGWLSEETVDDLDRLSKDRVWVVDPIDGTREFVAGIPEWCVSVGLIEHGRPVAGGICSPATGETVIGSIETGVRYTGPRPGVSATGLRGAVVLASRSEVERGEWDRFRHEPFTIVPMGSVALKLGLVAAQRADATWTHVPKHDWDIGAGAALVASSGGLVWSPDGAAPRWNAAPPLHEGLVAASRGTAADVGRLLGFVDGST